MAKRKLDMLLDSARPSYNSVKLRLTPAKFKALEKDMKELVAVERKGRVLPSTAQIADYVKEEYGIEVTAATVRSWLNKIRKGGSI
jgi:hypothetical protein